MIYFFFINFWVSDENDPNVMFLLKYLTPAVYMVALSYFYGLSDAGYSELLLRTIELQERRRVRTRSDGDAYGNLEDYEIGEPDSEDDEPQREKDS
jgi:hypothetical protein